MNLYAVIDTVTPAPAGLIVSAVLCGADASAKHVGLLAEPPSVTEMAATDAVDNVITLRLLDDDTLFVRAVITARDAAEKVEAGVYRAVMLDVARDGSVERIALVDQPGCVWQTHRQRRRAAAAAISGRNENAHD
ncbi:MAG TPA: hypothetical protein VG651_24050 [Stellaceae bacterium]|nr:hypothetical protein [Stellaceae bacterium]